MSTDIIEAVANALPNRIRNRDFALGSDGLGKVTVIGRTIHFGKGAYPSGFVQKLLNEEIGQQLDKQ